MRFVPGDGRSLPFEDRSFDLVHASAVIEHVGTRDDQARFLAELWRVARVGAVLTTPNRWFPVELHTSLPLLHWLPGSTYRWTLRRIGLDFHAQVTNLNLLSRRDLLALSRATGIPIDVRSVRLAGWPSNLVLIARPTQWERSPRRCLIERLELLAGRNGSRHEGEAWGAPWELSDDRTSRSR